jgi:hypothetical protein
MKQLKFRAWDQFNAVFYYSDNYKNLFEFFKAVQKCIDGGNYIVIQEYTGLKDKKDVEIYEGDIIKAESYLRSGVFVVIFKNGCFSAEKFILSNYRNNIKIIGNIYENQELFKGKA